MQRHSLRILVEDELPVIRLTRAVAQVIYTLIDNATKYSPAETTITIRAGRLPGEMIQIAVEDQGPGIPGHLRKRVFEKFYQATERGADADRPEGIGMGLSIAKGSVDAHGGRIWIEDGTGGHGVRVSFTVPVGDDQEAATMLHESVPGLTGRFDDHGE